MGCEAFSMSTKDSIAAPRAGPLRRRGLLLARDAQRVARRSRHFWRAAQVPSSERRANFRKPAIYSSETSPLIPKAGPAAIQLPTYVIAASALRTMAPASAFAVLFAAALPGIANGFGFSVAPGTRQCFQESAKASERVSGEWSVRGESSPDLDVTGLHI
eukprot:687549-Pleurochrysis_carterae.AAC.2